MQEEVRGERVRHTSELRSAAQVEEKQLWHPVGETGYVYCLDLSVCPGTHIHCHGHLTGAWTGAAVVTSTVKGKARTPALSVAFSWAGKEYQLHDDLRAQPSE